MGRPTKLTPETQERIVRAIRVGATYELAAQFGGITYQTFLNWMTRGQGSRRGRYFEFFEAVKRAEGEAAIKWLALIDKAAATTWQAAAWKIERRYPQWYGRRVELTHRDWRDALVEGLKQHEIDPEDVVEEFGIDLATELFAAAGIQLADAGAGGAAESETTG